MPSECERRGIVATTTSAELIARLQQWGAANGVARDPYLARLINALEQEQHLSWWATLNPFDLLPTPTARGVERHLQMSRRLAMWRNVIIFLPLALTWYSIAEATSAFEEFVSRNATSTANFLEFWQNGYGILPDFWRIGSVARLDVVIILIIIGMTVASGMLHARANQTDAADGERIEHERIALALDISKYLHDRREVSSTVINDAVADALAELRRATQELVRASDDIAAVNGTQTDLRPQMSALVEQLTQLTNLAHDNVRDAGSTLTGAVNTLANTVVELDSALRGDVVGAGIGLAAAAKAVELQALELQRRFTALLDTDR